MSLMRIDATYHALEKWLFQESEEVGFDFWIVDMRRTMRMLQTPSSVMENVLSPKERIRLGAFSMPKKKVQWISGRYAVKKALIKHMSVCDDQIDLCSIDVLSGENSAPYIPQFADVHVTITHSFPYCIGVVSKRRIGIDLERVVDLRPTLLAIYFHSHEIQELEQSNTVKDVHHAMVYWTRKEAVSKLLGLGMKADFKRLDTVEDRVDLGGYDFGEAYLRSAIIDEFSCSVAYEAR